MANIYIPKSLPLTELPDEREQLTLAGYGDDMDFYVMKGFIENIFTRLGMTKRIKLNADCDRPYFHPGRRADIVYEGTAVGYIGEIHPDVAAAYGFKSGVRVYTAVLDMPSVTGFVNFDRKHEGVAKYPAVTRDLSMLVPKHICAGDIEDMLIQRGGRLLESLRLFDIYEGAQIKSGFKSMAYSIVFRAKDRTLEESDITAAMKKIWNGLESLGIETRS